MSLGFEFRLSYSQQYLVLGLGGLVGLVGLGYPYCNS